MVAVGGTGLVLTSPDGKTWTRRASGTWANLVKVLWTGDKLIAAGDSGTILTSTDGVAWQRMNSGTDKPLSYLFADGNGFVTGGSNFLLTSADGSAWTRRAIPDSLYGLSSMVWTGSAYVSLCNFQSLCVSPDGIAWSKSGFSGPYQYSMLAFHKGRIYAFGTWMPLISSADGKSWDSEVQDVNYTYVGAASRGDTLLAVSWYGGILRFVDNTHFAIEEVPGKNNLRAVVWTGSQFVAVGEGMIATSADGKAWEKQMEGWGWDLNYVSKVGADWFAYGDTGMALISKDGVSWKHAPDPKPRMHATCRLGDLLIGLTPFGIYTSPNGVDWTASDYKGVPELYACAVKDGQAIVTAEFGNVLTSRDGVLWKKHEITGVFDGDLEIVSATRDRYVANTFPRGIATSTDGIAWQQSRNTFPENPTSLVWTGDRLIALMKAGKISTSTDGISWLEAKVPVSTGINAGIWTGGTLVAVGDGGAILTSKDGLAWTAQASGTGYDLNDVRMEDGLLVAVGNAHAVVTATADPSPALFRTRVRAARARLTWKNGNLRVENPAAAWGLPATAILTPDGRRVEERGAPAKPAP